jgi:hypothetical protein
MEAVILVVQELPLGSDLSSLSSALTSILYCVYFPGQMLVALGRHVHTQLQHFVANDETAVYLTRRVYGLTETAKLAAEYIDADNEQLKGLQELLVEIVGFLSGMPSAASRFIHFGNTPYSAALKQTKVYLMFSRAGKIAREFIRIDKYVSHSSCVPRVGQSEL